MQQMDSEVHGRRSVLGRAFDILDCFADASELGVSAICTRTGLPPATVHRMLSSLVEWGAVERVAHGRYRLGARIWRLGMAAPGVKRLRDLAQPYLVNLHLRTKGTVYLGVRDGEAGLFSDRITLVKPSVASTRATRRLPLHRSGGGRVLLAYSPDAWSSLSEEAASDPELADCLAELSEQLQAIRSSGIAVSHNDGLPGRTSVGSPVFDADGGIVASIAVAFPSTRIKDPWSIVPVVRSTARVVTADLARQAGA